MGGMAGKDERRRNCTAGSHRPERRSDPIINHTSSIINQDGFTLIELLVVTAVIALLLAALLPALGAARKHARSVVCQSNLKQWGATLALYTEDNQGRFPAEGAGLSGIWLLRGVFLPKDDPNADTSAFHHFGTRNIALCPMAVRSSWQSGNMRGSSTLFGSYRGAALEGTLGSRFTAWEILKPAPVFRCSYGCNQYVFKGLSQFARRTGQNSWVGLNVFSLRGGAAIPLLLDSWMSESQPSSFFPPPTTEEGSPGDMGSFCMNRHGAHSNGLFLDWSVRPVGLKELWTLEWYDKFDTAGPWTKAGGAKPEDWPKWMRPFKDY
jgi:prepilin-type N-terminal cleavage/methylation domain-containing protein